MKPKTQFARGAICFGMLFGLTKPAQAGVADPIIGFFGMPTAVDPAKLFLFTPGTSTPPPTTRAIQIMGRSPVRLCCLLLSTAWEAWKSMGGLRRVRCKFPY